MHYRHLKLLRVGQFALLLSLLSPLNGQTVIETNNTTCCFTAGDNKSAFITVTGGQRYIHAYSKADFNNQITGSVTIDKIAWNIGVAPNPAPFTFQNVSVRMKEFAATTFCPGTGGTTTVFSGNITISGTGWLELDLTPDFNWTNVDANYLWVEVCFDEPSPLGITPPQLAFFSGTNACRQHQSNHSGISNYCSTTALNGAAQSSKSSIRLTLLSGCASPSGQTSGLSGFNATSNSAQIGWSIGSGTGRVIYINTSNTFTDPVNGTNPVANTTYSGGQQCIFNGNTAAPINVTGLTPGTTYYLRAYEYCLPERNYSTQQATDNPGSFTTPSGGGGGTPCTAPSQQANSISFTNIGQTTASVNWTNGNGAGRVAFINSTNTFSAPVNGSNPTANTLYTGGEQCIFNGSGGVPVNVSGLTANSQYFVRVYEYCSPDRTYQQSAETSNPASFTTTGSGGGTCQVPTIQSSDINATLINNQDVTLSWNGGNGNGRAVFINTTNNFTAPVNGTQPTPALNYSGGQQCIYVGSSNGPITVSGLNPNTSYYVRAYEFCSPDYLYNTLADNNNPYSFTTSDASLILSPTQLLNLNYTEGFGPSGSQSYIAMASNLSGTGNLSVQASAHLELSTDNALFSDSLQLPYGGGVLTGQPITVYVRLKAGFPAGMYATETVTHSGGGLSVQNLQASGQIFSPNTSILQEGELVSLIAIPNPAKDHTRIVLSNSQKGKINLRLYSAEGRLLREETHLNNAEAGEIRIERLALPAGLYLIELNWPQTGVHAHLRISWMD